MRAGPDFSMHPDVLFLDPWRDPGLYLLAEPEFVWRKRTPGRISGFSVSAHDEIRKKTEGVITQANRNSRFGSALEYASVPVVLERARFFQSFVEVCDRWWLTGAAGTRMINRARRAMAQSDMDADARLQGYFAAQQAENETRAIPLFSGMLETDIAFAVPCRNTFNYFHFLTESLAQLTVLDGAGFEGNIYFHFPNTEERQMPFAEAFVETLFPEFAGRVFFERAPKDYRQVLSCFDMIGGHFQAPQAQTAGIARHLPPGLRGQEAQWDFSTRRALGMNTVNTALLRLRARAIAAIEGMDTSHLPKRFFVGRDTRHSRARHMEGEDQLFEHLAMFGFDYVVFESLTPLEQIALMANAEVMVSYHGAGFTNMLFASPDTCAIEIGTLQTARHRWGDFWPLAHASGCRYVTFFADFKSENPTVEPNFDEDGLVPAAMSEQAIGQLTAFVVCLLGQYPTLETMPPLRDLARQLLDVGAAAHALALLEQHQAICDRYGILCLLKADCHKDMDEPKSELVALDQAFKLDPKRWQTLVRMIWCANRCERPQVIRWALARLKSDFPDRHGTFVGNHDWVRFVA